MATPKKSTAVPTGYKSPAPIGSKPTSAYPTALPKVPGAQLKQPGPFKPAAASAGSGPTPAKLPPTYSKLPGAGGSKSAVPKIKPTKKVVASKAPVSRKPAPARKPRKV